MIRRSHFGCTQWCSALVAAIAICSVAVLPASADPSAADQIKDIVDATLKHPYQAHAVQGILVQSMDTGKVIYDHNGDMMLIPASNMKLIATSAAYELIGPDYKMTTSLFASAKPRANGVLKGDLILVGQADPMLRVEHLQQMVDKLRASGIKTIKGNIVGDDSWFDDKGLGEGWGWDDEQYYDCSQPTGLNVNENFVYVYVRPGSKIGAPAEVELLPSTGYLKVVNNAVTSKADTRYTADATRLHAQNTIVVNGNVPIDFKGINNGWRETGMEVQVNKSPYYKGTDPVERLTMENPTLFTLTVFKELLEQSGIKVTGEVKKGTKPANSELIATHDSPPLSEIIHVLLKPSDNFMAECMLKHLGKVVRGNGSYAAGIEVEKEWLKSIGADMEQIYIADSSGQSRGNLISPHNLVVLLTHMYHTKYYDILANSLPIAGIDSHLQNRMLGTPAVNNVKAKTGYIPRQCSLSGYVKTLAGENMAVSVIQNNHLCSLDEAYVMQDVIFTAVSKITTRTDAADQK